MIAKPTGHDLSDGSFQIWKIELHFALLVAHAVLIYVLGMSLGFGDRK